MVQSSVSAIFQKKEKVKSEGIMDGELLGGGGGRRVGRVIGKVKQGEVVRGVYFKKRGGEGKKSF